MLFDLGGTLIEERDPERWANEATAVGIEVEAEALSHWFDEVEKENDLAGEWWSAEEFWRRVLEHASERPVDPARLNAFLDRSRLRPSSPALFSDVRQCLAALRRWRLKLGIVSNSSSESHVRELLDQVGIHRFFETVVSSGTEGVAKPNPEIFRRAVTRLGVRPEETFYVGNLPHVDAVAAKSAGLHSVWLHRAGTGFGEDPPEITSLSELPFLIRAAGRST